MTFIISDEGVRNTQDTEVTMGGNTKIKIGKDLVNEGKMSLHGTDLEVGESLIQRGDFRVNDPQYFAQVVLELTKSTKDITSFGVAVMKLLQQ